MRGIGLTLLCLLAALVGAAPTQPGLALTLEVGGKTDTRAERLVALHVPAGEPVSPFLPAGPFKARWEGVIVAALRTEVRFHATATGSFTCKVNGQPVFVDGKSVAVTLNQGDNPIVLEYTSPTSGDATLRLDWSSRAFPREPLSPLVLRHDPALTAAGESVREGRRLFAQLRCAQCHLGADKLPPAGQGMPELAQDAPLLANLGERYTQGFLFAWIQDPHAFRPGSLMPKVFPGDLAHPDVRSADLAAYLAAQGSPAASKPVDPAQAALGGALFANLGCIACHTEPGTTVAEAGQRIPLAHVAAKWHAVALADYLKDPAKSYRATRMPNFRLSDAEASQLAAYLLANAKQTLPSAPAGDATKGATALVAAGCLNCHAGAAIPGRTTLADTLKSGWTKGCVADAPSARGTAPDFALTASQVAALRAFAATDLSSLKQDVPSEYAARQVRELRCAACHEMDGRPSAWSTLEDACKRLRDGAPKVAHKEGDPVFDAPVPPLTWAGEKLRPQWSAAFIAGEPQPKPRYWMIARMPGYAFHAQGLATGLSHQHGFGCADAPSKPVDAEAASMGATLLGAQGGFNCIQCHPVGLRPATAPFEAPSTNLASAVERLRPSFYARWMLAPARVTPGTKMPKFADDEGRTQISDTLDGEAKDQFEAIWEHLRTVQPVR